MSQSNNKESKLPRRGALGKGLNSLLGLPDDLSTETNHNDTPDDQAFGNVIKIKVTDIEPNPHQPRKIMSQEALDSLAKSIAEDGVIQPIIVKKSDQPGHYTLIAGERRWRASQIAGLKEVPVIIKDIASQDMLRVALIENVQRADLNIVEEAEAYASLINDFGLTQDQCAKKVGKDRTTITNTLRLLTLPKEIQDDLTSDRLSMGHGRCLLSLEDKKIMLRARDIVVKKSLNVRQTEKLCKRIKSFGFDKQSNEQSRASADLEYLAESLRSQLRTKVKFAGSGTRGKIEISYFSAAELERILGLIAPRIS